MNRRAPRPHIRRPARRPPPPREDPHALATQFVAFVAAKGLKPLGLDPEHLGELWKEFKDEVELRRRARMTNREVRRIGDEFRALVGAAAPGAQGETLREIDRSKEAQA